MKQTLYGKTKTSKIKSPSNNDKIQSEENLTKQIYFFVTTKHMGLYINKTK